MSSAQIKALIGQGVEALKAERVLPEDVDYTIDLAHPDRVEHGDLSSNIALALARHAKMPPRQFAESLRSRLPVSDLVERIEIAGPGFINFFLTDQWLHEVVEQILESKGSFGRSTVGGGKRIQVEYGSANPTGPIHVGNSRNIIYGDALANLLAAAGYQVERENYLNDTGGQVQRFALSLEARYRQALGQEAEVPEDGYQGDYLIPLGQELARKEGMGLIGKLDELAVWGIEEISRMHRQTFARIGVHHDHWASQKAIEHRGKVDEAIKRLQKAGALYEDEGATWFRATDHGHNQDQVIIRSKERGGLPTYLAADAGYLLDKISRGYERVIYFWGADHHNTAGALKAVAKAFEVDDKVEIIIYQFVSFEGGRLSKRSGEFVSLDEMIEEVGADATRFTFLMRSPDSAMVFDFDLVKKQSNENPVYYVQYAHARICSILRYAEEQGKGLNAGAPLVPLTHQSELFLMKKLSEYPDLIEHSARLRAPYRIANYVHALASLFTAFYRDCRVMTEDELLTQARLTLAEATRQVIANSLEILGVSAPERM